MSKEIYFGRKCNLLLSALLYEGNNHRKYMQDLENIVIPIVAITSVFSIPILAIVYHYRQKGKEMEERKLMIEKGIMPPPLTDDRQVSKGSAKQKGLNLLAVGLGLFVGYALTEYLHMQRIFAIGGSILLFLGIANVIVVFTDNNKEKNDEQ